MVYLVIGSNDFWYAIEDSRKNAVAFAKSILKDEAGYFDDPETGHSPERPEILYIYKAEEVARVENE